MRNSIPLKPAYTLEDKHMKFVVYATFFILLSSICVGAENDTDYFLEKYFENGLTTKLIGDVTFNTKFEKDYKFAMFKAMAIHNHVIYSVERISVRPSGNLLSFATSANTTVRLEGKGIQAEDPRVFIYREYVYVLFITTLCASFLGYERGLAVTPFDDFQPVCLHFPGMKKGLRVSEKNWAPLVVKDHLYFVYVIEPLIVLKYDLNANGSCAVIVNETAGGNGTESQQFSTAELRIRGGSNYINYHGQYYIGAGHSFEWKKINKRRKKYKGERGSLKVFVVSCVAAIN